MAITSIPVLSDISRTPKIMANEVDKFNSLINKYTALTTSGFQTFTSQSSGTTYNTIANGGETELLSILITAINANSASPCIFTASHFNSIKSTLEVGSGSGVHADLIDNLHGSDIAKLAGGNTFIGEQIVTDLRMKSTTGSEGGGIILEKPQTGTVLTHNIRTSITGNDFIVVETGGASRGAFLPINKLPAGISSEILTSNTASFREYAIPVGTVSINSLLTSGQYWSNSLTDLPAALQGQFLYIDVIRYDNLNVFQKITSFSSGTWVRYKTAGTFGGTFEMFNEESYGKVKAINAPKTLDLTDNRKFIYVVTGGVISIPHSSTTTFPIGATIAFAAYTGASVSFLPVGATTLSSKDSKRTFNGVFAGATLKHVELNSWWLTGDLIV